MSTGPEQLRELGKRLKDAGNEGQKLKRNLSKQIREAARPIAEKISDLEHLKPYLPDRYAEVLSEDLTLRTTNFFVRNPRVEIQAKAREHRRKIVLLDNGFINHPKWPHDLPRKEWKWQNRQTGGMKPGFFSDPCEEASPHVRGKVLQAMAETSRQIMS